MSDDNTGKASGGLIKAYSPYIIGESQPKYEPSLPKEGAKVSKFIGTIDIDGGGQVNQLFETLKLIAEARRND